MLQGLVGYRCMEDPLARTNSAKSGKGALGIPIEFVMSHGAQKA
jgi:hypothetical protein